VLPSWTQHHHQQPPRLFSSASLVLSSRSPAASRRRAGNSLPHLMRAVAKPTLTTPPARLRRRKTADAILMPVECMIRRLPCCAVSVRTRKLTKVEKFDKSEKSCERNGHARATSHFPGLVIWQPRRKPLKGVNPCKPSCERRRGTMCERTRTLNTHAKYAQGCICAHPQAPACPECQAVRESRCIAAVCPQRVCVYMCVCACMRTHACVPAAGCLRAPPSSSLPCMQHPSHGH